MSTPIRLERRGRAWPLSSALTIAVTVAMWLVIGILIGASLNCGGK